ncbi:hypothetical protein Ancab_037988 [Ancistrocladus abbreviatus]
MMCKMIRVCWLRLGTIGREEKASVRGRHSSGTRRSNYNYDRSEHHGDKDGNWNISSKSRVVGCSHSRNEAADKSSSRLDRLATNESCADRSWGSYRRESVPLFQSKNGPLQPNSSETASGSVMYEMYPLPGMSPSGVTSNGPPGPPAVMYYPYDHNSDYGTPGEQLEFGSLGPMGFMGTGTNELSQLNEATQTRGTIEKRRFHGSSVPQSSPDQPCSPHRRV